MQETLGITHQDGVVEQRDWSLYNTICFELTQHKHVETQQGNLISFYVAALHLSPKDNNSYKKCKEIDP